MGNNDLNGCNKEVVKEQSLQSFGGTDVTHTSLSEQFVSWLTIKCVLPEYKSQADSHDLEHFFNKTAGTCMNLTKRCPTTCKLP